MSGETILSAENSEQKSLAVRVQPEPCWVAHSTPPDPLTNGACCPCPRTPLRSRSSALIFGRSQQSAFPPMHRGIDKNTGNAHFRSQRMHQNAGFCIKNIQKNQEVATPGPPAAEWEIYSHPPPCSPARCWCPSASSRLATALAMTTR